MDYQGNMFGGFPADTNWIFTTIMPTGETGHMACWEDPDQGGNICKLAGSSVNPHK